MRRSERIGIETFAVGSGMAIEGRAIPGRDAGFVIVRLFARIVPGVANLIGRTDFVDAGIRRDGDSVVTGASCTAGCKRSKNRDGGSCAGCPNHSVESEFEAATSLVDVERRHNATVSRWRMRARARSYPGRKLQCRFSCGAPRRPLS